MHIYGNRFFWAVFGNRHYWAFPFLFSDWRTRKLLSLHPHCWAGNASFQLAQHSSESATGSFQDSHWVFISIWCIFHLLPSGQFCFTFCSGFQREKAFQVFPGALPHVLCALLAPASPGPVVVVKLPQGCQAERAVWRWNPGIFYLLGYMPWHEAWLTHRKRTFFLIHA